VTQPDLPPSGDPPAERLDEVVRHMRAWFALEAHGAGGGVQERLGGVLPWTWARDLRSATVAYPPALAGGELVGLAENLATAARRLGVEKIGWWSALPPQPPELGTLLAARGWWWGWQPQWMGRALRDADLGGGSVPGVHIGPVERSALWTVRGLPYHCATAARVRDAMVAREPRRMWHLAAWRGDRVIGHAVLHVPAGADPVAGLFDVGVVADERRRGIGRALTLAALRHAADLGCAHALLNATGEGEALYRTLGFSPLARGQTWWLQDALHDLPSAQETAFVEAIGFEDMRRLDELWAAGVRPPLDEVLRCGVTPLRLAVLADRRCAVDWLVEHGATPAPMAFVDLRWWERLDALLRAQPAVASAAFDGRGATLLHLGVERDEPELVALALAHRAEPAMPDASGAPALDWARRLDRERRFADLLNPPGGA
jgi:ribosomal protein S18 acetylase RimI-like enzyme